MKTMKKITSFLLVAVLVLGMSAGVFAAGEKGSITIKKSSTLSVEGRTFKVYRILDAQTNGAAQDAAISYTVPEALKDTYRTELSIAEATNDIKFNQIVIEKIAALAAQQVRDLADAVIASGNVPAENISEHTASPVADDGSFKIENLDLGYYILKDITDVNSTDNALSAVMVATNRDIEITLKGDKPSIEKKIDGSQDNDPLTSGLVDTDEVAIGDTVPYVLTTKIPDHTHYKTYGVFTIQDKLSAGLTFDKSSLKVYVNDVLQTVDTDYELTTEGLSDGLTFKLNLKNIKARTVGHEVKVTYNAVLNENAIIGSAGNPNDVQLVYSNNPDWEGTGGNENEPTGETPWDKVKTYVTGLKLIKTEEGQDTKYLAGAKFKLEGERINKLLVTKAVFEEATNGTFWKLTDGTYTNTDPSTVSDTSAYESTTIKYNKTIKRELVEKTQDTVIEGITDENGVVRFEGLAAGSYTLTELIAPAGYNLLKDPITITIACTLPTNGVVTGDEQCTWVATVDGKTLDTEKLTADITDHILGIENSKGTQLPETGGMGTTILYVLGAMLAVGAAVILVTRKIVGQK